LHAYDLASLLAASNGEAEKRKTGDQRDEAARLWDRGFVCAGADGDGVLGIHVVAAGVYIDIQGVGRGIADDRRQRNVCVVAGNVVEI